MLNPIFSPDITPSHKNALRIFIDSITDGKTEIPDEKNSLDYLRVNHIQIGVFDSMDVTYLLHHLLEALRKRNADLIYVVQ